MESLKCWTCKLISMKFWEHYGFFMECVPNNDQHIFKNISCVHGYSTSTPGLSFWRVGWLPSNRHNCVIWPKWTFSVHYDHRIATIIIHRRTWQISAGPERPPNSTKSSRALIIPRHQKDKSVMAILICMMLNRHEISPSHTSPCALIPTPDHTTPPTHTQS